MLNLPLHEHHTFHHLLGCLSLQTSEHVFAGFIQQWKYSFLD